MPVLTIKDPVNPGVVGLPDGVKEAGQRVDFKPDKFVLAVETKGYRLAWSRACRCPCIPVNQQTEQPDPTCSLCGGTGWFLFRPHDAVIDEKVTGNLDGVQQSLIGNYSVVIRGIMSGIMTQYQGYDILGARLEGTAAVSVRYENKLGYYDRLINLDATIAYVQILESDGSLNLETRYVARQVNLLRSATKVYVEDTDFTVTNGMVQWISGQEPGSSERLAIHYLTHPVWRIIEHPHGMRLTPVKFKGTEDTPTELPVQGIAKYEFLLDGF
jgi:hypothetical protein